jgi:hypothetical protein
MQLAAASAVSPILTSGCLNTWQMPARNIADARITVD